jgi:HEAT repeat protein
MLVGTWNDRGLTMKKRLVLWLSISLVALLAVAGLWPTSRYRLIALLTNEPLAESRAIRYVVDEDKRVHVVEEAFSEARPISFWIDQLHDAQAARREQAAKAVGSIGSSAKAAVPALLQAVEDQEARVRLAAIQSLGRIGPDAKDAAPALIQVYQQGNEAEDIRKAAVAALGNMGPAAQDAVGVMIKTLAEDESLALSGHVQMAVMRLGPAAVPDLIELLQDQDPDVRAHAAVALNWVGPGARDAVPALVRALQDEGHSVREGAAFALLRIGPGAKDAIPALVKALQDKDSEVRRIAAMALQEIDPHAAQEAGVK